MQKDSKFLDDLARLGSSALGSAMDLTREIEAAVSAKVDNMLLKHRVVTREEHELVGEMALKAREENEKLKERVAALEKKLGELAKK